MVETIERAVPSGAKRFIVITHGHHDREPSGQVVSDPSCKVRGHVVRDFDSLDKAIESCEDLHRPPMSLTVRAHVQVYDRDDREILFDSPPPV